MTKEWLCAFDSLISLINEMAEIAFMSVDPDNETSDHEDFDNSDESANVDVHVPKIEEVY